MEVDDLTRKRIHNFKEELWEIILHNNDKDLVQFASGGHYAISKILQVLQIENSD